MARILGIISYISAAIAVFVFVYFATISYQEYFHYRSVVPDEPSFNIGSMVFMSSTRKVNKDIEGGLHFFFSDSFWCRPTGNHGNVQPVLYVTSDSAGWQKTDDYETYRWSVWIEPRIFQDSWPGVDEFTCYGKHHVSADISVFGIKKEQPVFSGPLFRMVRR